MDSPDAGVGAGQFFSHIIGILVVVFDRHVLDLVGAGPSDLDRLAGECDNGGDLGKKDGLPEDLACNKAGRAADDELHGRLNDGRAPL